MRPSLLLHLLLATTTVGCAVTPDTLGETEDEHRVKPKGSDPGAGTVTVRAPVASWADNGFLDVPGFGESRLVSFGSPSSPRTSCQTGTGIDVPFGRYTLLVRYRREGLTTPAIDTNSI